MFNKKIVDYFTNSNNKDEDSLYILAGVLAQWKNAIEDKLKNKKYFRKFPFGIDIIINNYFYIILVFGLFDFEKLWFIKLKSNSLQLNNSNKSLSPHLLLVQLWIFRVNTKESIAFKLVALQRNCGARNACIDASIIDDLQRSGVQVSKKTAWYLYRILRVFVQKSGKKLLIELSPTLPPPPWSAIEKDFFRPFFACRVIIYNPRIPFLVNM